MKNNKKKIKEEDFDLEEINQNLKRKIKDFNQNEILDPGIKLTQKQEELVEIIKNNEIIFIKGCWGTSKTFIACYSALQHLQARQTQKIMLSKPIVESEALGFLPGSEKEKIEPYAQSFWSAFEKLLERTDDLKTLKEKNLISFAPVAYMRGSNIDNSFIILDEAQNYTPKQLMTFITRLGQNSKMIIIGDHNQSDIPNKKSAFKFFYKELQGRKIKKIGFFEFGINDIKRNPILIEITRWYEDWKSQENKNEDLSNDEK